VLKVGYFVLKVIITHSIEGFPMSANLVQDTAKGPYVCLLVKGLSDAYLRGAVVESPYK
jgi:hypothetical protein